MDHVFFDDSLILLADASSLIYLNKANLLELLFKNLNFITTKRVYLEVNKKPNNIKNYFSNDGIKIYDKITEIQAIDGMSATDVELINIATRKNYVLLTDDGEICKFCRFNSLKYINSLIVIIILYKKSLISKNEAYDYIQKIINLGRYSNWVIDYVYKNLD